MALEKIGRYHYGDTRKDLRNEMIRFSRLNEYVINHFADAVCSCGNELFKLYLDEEEGAAIRVCSSCEFSHPIADSIDYLKEARLHSCICVCDNEDLELIVGLSLYSVSEDVRWIYFGCRCPLCRLLGVYGNWKCEYLGYKELLMKV